MKLTPDQQAAAHAPGSVAVTAGAGTGKTAMLAQRFLHHVTTDGYSPLQIVAVTFTDKAADELRSRIRKTVAASVPDPEVAAEVDAAQISTIHALAARICRDFYRIAGIPADFRIMDEMDGEMWRIAQIETAIDRLPKDSIEDVSFSRLTLAIKNFLDDPLTAEKALAVTPDRWKEEIDHARQRAVEEFINSAAVFDAKNVLRAFEGASDDKLEIARREGLRALEDIADGTDIAKSLKTIESFKASVGKQSGWPNGGLDEVKDALRSIKPLAKTCLGLYELEFNAGDEELARQNEILREAFEQVREIVEREKREARLLDYNDLEINALKILKDPAARAHYRERWKAVMVDEFQDTNAVQAEIVRLITEDAKVTIVGDEKQSIYGFRGAEVRVFGEFRNEIVSSGKGSSEKLSQSFRTHQSLVETTNSIFKPVLGDLHQDLSAARIESSLEGPYVELSTVEDVKGILAPARLNLEADYISDEIAKLLKSGVEVYDKELKANRPIECRDIAILSKVWAPLDVYVDALASKDIPAVHAGGGSLLETREAQDVHSLLGFIANPHNDVALVALLRSPFFAVSDTVLFEFAQTKQKKERWWTAMKRNPGTLSKPYSILETLVSGRDGMTAQELVIKADDMTGYSAVVANLPHGRRRESDWKGIITLLRDFEKKGRDDAFSVSRFMQQLIDFDADIPRPRMDAGNSVQLMTIHAAKGLEWPVVFIPSLTRRPGGGSDGMKMDVDLGVAFKTVEVDGEPVEPSIYKLISLLHSVLEEEEARRVLYVALTRAQEKIVLTASSSADAQELETLRPGLDNAGIRTKVISYVEERTVPATPLAPKPFESPALFQAAPLSIGLTELHVTGLTDYLKCPKQFKLRQIDGHPGIREGRANARVIGTLAHFALEKKFADAHALKKMDPLASEEQALTAFGLAEDFRTKSIYESVRVENAGHEVELELERGGLSLYGVADLVADEFVLDFKTDSDPAPHQHSLQLWTYARALGKPTAYIAYLRHDRLHPIDSRQLDKLDELADETIKGIVEGRFEAKPSVAACKFCNYRSICAEAADVD